MHYVFKAQSIHKFKYCPYCGSKFMSIYDGDYCGQLECYSCERDIEFDILEEQLIRHPKWIERFTVSS
jgi:transcription elongation factor Elf1